jgi:hypothetical protein
MVLYNNHVAIDEADELMTVVKDKSEEMELQWLAPILDESLISTSFCMPKPLLEDDENTEITGDCSTGIFPTSSDTLQEWLSNKSDLSFESMSDFVTSSPQNPSTKAYTNNSFIFIPDDIRYDGMVEVSSSRNKREISLLPRHSYQTDSIFVLRSRHNANLENNPYVSFEDEDSHLLSLRVEEEYKDVNERRLYFGEYDRENGQTFKEDNYWKKMTDKIGNANPAHTEARSVQLDLFPIEVDNYSSSPHSNAGVNKEKSSYSSRIPLWEEIHEFVFSTLCFSCNST